MTNRRRMNDHMNRLSAMQADTVKGNGSDQALLHKLFRHLDAAIFGRKNWIKLEAPRGNSLFVASCNKGVFSQLIDFKIKKPGIFPGFLERQ